MTEQLDIFGRIPERKPSEVSPHERAAEGIQRAGDHADYESHEWVQRAAGAIRRHAEATGRGFIVEEVSGDYPEPPPDKRAWGAAIRYAVRRGWVRKVGYSAEGTSNACAKCLWAKP